jgi:hypothetical protein
MWEHCLLYTALPAPGDSLMSDTLRDFLTTTSRPSIETAVLRIEQIFSDRSDRTCRVTSPLYLQSAHTLCQTPDGGDSHPSKWSEGTEGDSGFGMTLSLL